ncbi:MAG TPA: acetylornithine deacetylase [Aestuariivirgaceae bacterium]|nr:acetylornithine deacetylase [Aestuariivirgaceae bacterium]
MPEPSATRELLGQLIAFDTTSRNSNEPLIEFVEDYLGALGVPAVRVDYQPGKTNLWATIGPDIAGGIVLSGHTDVVPVDGQAWTSDPFSAVERAGKIYGRGTADMKGFLAACLALVPEFLGKPLKRPIHLAFSCDEEVGCTGVRPLIERIVAGDLPRPSAAIIGEPTLMKVVNGHKSTLSFVTEVEGHEAHSSLSHQGVNAIMVAGELISEITAIAGEMRERGDPTGRFDPPYSSVHIGTISGGTARNIVPRCCTFHWETRIIPGQDPDEIPERLDRLAETLLPAMQAVSPTTGITTRRKNIVPPLMPVPGSPAEALALQLTGGNDTGAVSYGTEAGLFQVAGIPAVICGPGSIEQAHKPDEFVAMSELERCEGFLRRLAEYCTRAI